MAKPAPRVETIKKSDKRWQSDVIVDMIKRYGFEYIALNPGASYRGCTILWSITARTIRPCCSASMKKSPCRSPMATPASRASR